VPHLENEEGNLSMDAGELPAVESFMDPRVPYNTENVLSSLLRILIKKRVLSINDAKAIMDSGKSYLH
jgi:hypothetical protein